jgi:hypothetical protein
MFNKNRCKIKEEINNLNIQGALKVLTRFCKVISLEPLGLQKWHGRQKMRLIIKFCLVFF